MTMELINLIQTKALMIRQGVFVSFHEDFPVQENLEL